MVRSGLGQSEFALSAVPSAHAVTCLAEGPRHVSRFRSVPKVPSHAVARLVLCAKRVGTAVGPIRRHWRSTGSTHVELLRTTDRGRSAITVVRRRRGSWNGRG